MNDYILEVIFTNGDRSHETGSLELIDAFLHGLLGSPLNDRTVAVIEINRIIATS